MARTERKQIAYRRLARRRRRLKIIKSICFTIVIMGLMALMIYLCQGRTINVSGNANVSSEKIKQDIFTNVVTENTLYQRVMGLLDRRVDLSYLDTYEIKYEGLDKMTVVAYEKNPVAYFVTDQGNVLFDKDGIVLRIQAEIPEGIPCIDGLKSEAITLYEPLSLQDKEVYSMLKNLVVQMEKNSLTPDRILLNDKNEMEIFFGNINVKLGTDSSLENKISRLIAIMPSVEGKSGILYMEDVDENTDKISFIKTKQ